MGYDIDISIPEGKSLPNPQERVVSFSSCPGNILSSLPEIGCKQLDELNRQEAIDALQKMIAEIDKGNEGVYNDSYFVKCDEQWSGGKETGREWNKVKGLRNRLSYCPDYFQSYEQYTGYMGRNRLRETAFRFFCYYSLGYEITYTW